MPSPTTFLDLPVEIQICILSKTSAGTIQRARGACSQLRDIVDNPMHEVLLFAPSKKALIHVIWQLADRILSYAEDESFLDVLHRFYVHRDYQTDVECRHDDFHAFATQWQLHRLRTHIVGLEAGIEKMYIIGKARAIWDVHMHYHAPNLADPNAVSVALDDFTKGMSFSAPYAHLCEPDSDHLLHKLQDTPNGILSDVPILSNTPTIGRVVPNWPLTGLKIMSSETLTGADQAKRDRLPGCCTVARLQDFTGAQLPPLPESGRFAYCVRTEWAYQQVKNALPGSTVAAAIRLALVEELFLY